MTEKEIKEKIAKVIKEETFDYQQFFELSTELVKKDTNRLRFFIDSGAVSQLGRNSIKDHKTAIMELVKNSYDADAKSVDIDIFINKEIPYIKILDNGEGMDEEEILKNWLRIGFSEKKISKRTIKKRRKTGEKGVGRLSADRLGSKLRLVSKKKNSNLIGVKLDWSIFDQPGIDLSLIPFEKISQGEIINLGFEEGFEGTELYITELRNEWTNKDIEELYKELSILIPPFSDVKDFEITIDTDFETSANGKVLPPKNYQPEIELLLTFHEKTEKEDAKIEYFIKDIYSFSDENVILTKWDEFQSGVIDVKKTPLKKSLSCGSFDLYLKFFPKDSPMAKKLGISFKDFRKYMDENAGVKIYRDFVGVKPYGFPNLEGGDWLNLGQRQSQNPAAVSRSDYRVSPAQIVGAVNVSRDRNPNLDDSTAREGLVHNDAYYDLRNITLAAIKEIEVHRYNVYQELFPPKKKEPVTKLLNRYKKELLSLKEELRKLKDGFDNKEEHAFSNANRRMESVIAQTDSTEKAISELLNTNRTLAGLATLGISSAVFGHEIETGISSLRTALKNAQMAATLEKPNLKLSLKNIENAIDFSKKISTWGEFALYRVKRDKRRKKKTNITHILENIILQLQPNFLAANIKIISNLTEVIERTFEMDIETIFINLMTNAYKACKAKSKNRVIEVALSYKNNEDGKQGFEIVVSDSGPGVPENRRDLIWEALWTSNINSSNSYPDTGTGLGLSIVQSIIDELSGARRVDDDPKLGGARFSIWLPN